MNSWLIFLKYFVGVKIIGGGGGGWGSQGSHSLYETDLLWIYFCCICRISHYYVAGCAVDGWYTICEVGCKQASDEHIATELKCLCRRVVTRLLTSRPTTQWSATPPCWPATLPRVTSCSGRLTSLCWKYTQWMFGEILSRCNVSACSPIQYIWKCKIATNSFLLACCCCFCSYSNFYHPWKHQN